MQHTGRAEEGEPVTDLHTANPWRKSNRCIIAPEDPWLDIPISKQSLLCLSALFQTVNCPVRVKTEFPASLLPLVLHRGEAGPPCHVGTGRREPILCAGVVPTTCPMGFFCRNPEDTSEGCCTASVQVIEAIG